MATKNNAGEFDCYKALANDEPYFLLRANDPCAPQIVRQWARNYVTAKLIDREGSDPEKVWTKYDEALETATVMEIWHATRLVPCGACGMIRKDHGEIVGHSWRIDKPPVPASIPMPAKICCAVCDTDAECEYPGGRPKHCPRNPVESHYAGLDRQSKDAQDNGDRPNDAAIGTSVYG